MFGIQVNNSSGVEIISSNYINYMIVARGTLASRDTLPTLSSGQALIVRPTGTDYSGATIRPDISNAGGTNLSYSSTTGFFEYAIIARSVSQVTGQYGFCVYLADGTVAFDSRRSYLIPLAATTVAISSTESVIGIPATQLSGRKRWAMFHTPFLGIYPAQQGPKFISTYCRYITSNSIGLKSGPASVGPYVPNGLTFTNTALVSFFEA